MHVFRAIGTPIKMHSTYYTVVKHTWITFGIGVHIGKGEKTN